MYKLNKYFCYKISYHGTEILNETLKNFDRQGQIEVVNDFENLLSMDIPYNSHFFVFVDELMTLDNLEKIIKKTAHFPLNIVLKNKNFDALMLCHRFQVNFIFEQDIEKHRLENALIKASLHDKHNQEKIPALEVMKLFSAPIKIKHHQDLFEKLCIYLHGFNEIEAFGVLCIKDGTHEFHGDQFPPQEFKELFKEKVVKSYIGYEKELSPDLIATPLYINSSESVWALIKVAKANKKYILNHLFYKYLENVLIYRTNKEKEKTYEELAVTDDVTGLYNQRKLSEDLDRLILEHKKIKGSFSIMFLDVDHFKSVNDNYGHIIGSQLLIDIGITLKKYLRGSDLVYRYGGDEFVVVMPNIEINLVHTIAVRILDKIKANEFKISSDETYKLSLSIGIAEYPSDAETAKEIIKFADEMMYMSKKSGRGKVFHLKEVKNAIISSK